ncbi:c-type cytochrome biogenesis protein CcmI [Thiopseudomonas denitrificans]
MMQEQQAVDALMSRIPAIQEPQAREQAMSELIARLENIVRMQPEAADVWFFLGRSYMNDQRVADAAHAYSRAMDAAGRQPEILAQWVQAQFFANDSQWNDELQQAVEEVLEADPQDATTLGLIGIAGFETGNFNVARDSWNRLLGFMDPRDPSAQAVLTGVERAEKAIEEFGENNPQAVRGPVLPPLPEPSALSQSGRVLLEISLSDELAASVDPAATVFVFARSPESGQIPIAAQRLSVAGLPATIELSDADAVMTELQLSKAGSVEVQASISSDGNASEPEWVSASLAAEVESGKALELVIDRPARGAR